MHFFSLLFAYHHHWPTVTKAVFQKYPNPFASHVISSDVIDRHIDAETGMIHTTRLFLKQGVLPKWAQKLWNISQAYIIEQSIVHPSKNIMITVTRNLSHTKLMLVEETQIIRPHPDDPIHMTQVEASARIISNTGWDSLKSRIEKFGLKKGRDNMMRSAKGLKHVLDSMSVHQ